MKRYLPNLITLFNLLCGSLVLVCIFNNEYNLAGKLMLLAFIADFLDGLVARTFSLYSDLGKELDSLADLVSFGVVPGAMMYVLLSNEIPSGPVIGNFLHIAAIPGFLLTVFSAMRLARFNVDSGTNHGFTGLATPAATAFITGIYLIYYNNPMNLQDTLGAPWLLYIFCISISYLMISNIKMFSFKKVKWGWKGNEFRILFIVLGLTLMMLLKIVAIPLMIVIYILLSLINNIVAKPLPIEVGEPENA